MHRGGHTQTMQGGLVKPITQRGRTTASRRVRNPAVNTNATGGGGIICGSRNDSLFVSSYHEDKRAKYRKQMKERMKKWVVLGALTLFFYTVIRMSRSSEEVPTSLRSGVAQPNNAIVSSTKSETKSVPPTQGCAETGPCRACHQGQSILLIHRRSGVAGASPKVHPRNERI